MKSRINLFYLLLVIGLLTLVVRLGQLQIVLGARNRELAEGNRIKKEIITAPRGIIFDRHDRPLVRNIPVYRLREEDKIITREEALRLEARGGKEAEGLETVVGRDYLYKSALAHVLGYLDWELAGTTGIEQHYDATLVGQDGGEIYEVDSQGVKIRPIDKIKPIAGQDLHLVLDGELSRVAYEALEGQTGAVIATEVATGQVLVLVSSPSFDPNLFVRVGQRDDQRIEKLLTDPDKPFFNRALGGAYAPGSTFKIVSATAGLEEGKITANTHFQDEGIIKIGDYSYTNWYFTKQGKTEGSINVVRAIARSTDTFFYQLGERLGANQLAEWAKAFGLGRKTGIDLGGEIAGLVPDPKWKKATTGERWFLGNTYHFAIGQADLLATPLQINMMMAAIANQGQLCQPMIKKKGEPQCQDLKISPTTLDLVKQGLEEACSPGGTAGVFFNFEPPTACKTGTAEFNDPAERTHAWLTAFAPTDDPEIVVTALVEAGGEGSTVAAPIVKRVLKAWFERSQ